MARTKAQIAASKRYEKKSYKSIEYRLTLDDDERLRAYLDSTGETANGFVIRAISAALDAAAGTAENREGGGSDGTE